VRFTVNYNPARPPDNGFGSDPDDSGAEGNLVLQTGSGWFTTRLAASAGRYVYSSGLWLTV